MNLDYWTPKGKLGNLTSPKCTIKLLRTNRVQPVRAKTITEQWCHLQLAIQGLPFKLEQNWEGCKIWSTWATEEWLGSFRSSVQEELIEPNLIFTCGGWSMNWKFVFSFSLPFWWGHEIVTRWTWGDHTWPHVTHMTHYDSLWLIWLI